MKHTPDSSQDQQGPACYPLYDSRWEHDACGMGFLAQVSGSSSHSLVQSALDVLTRMTHRGAQDADAETNDGAGILTQIPYSLLASELAKRSIPLSHPEDLALGMIFLPANEQAGEESRSLIEQVFAECNLPLLTWRQPLINYTVLGTKARSTAPDVQQVLLTRPPHLEPEAFEHALYHARRLIEKRLEAAQISDCYVASLSHLTVVYKGLLAPDQLSQFYLDLADTRFSSSFAVFHQRYSTNTFPAWQLAQPFRFLAHNGEINTIQGNHTWMHARSQSMEKDVLGEYGDALLPVIGSGSDSARLDNALEFFVNSGRSVVHSMEMLAPPAWESDPHLDDAFRAWCEYHAGMMEPWDGPAALVFTDGRFVGATLDRNGLRPARYTLTSNGVLIVASEAGVLPVDDAEVVEHGRLGPGEMIAVDLVQHQILHNDDIRASLASQQPYEQWLAQHLVRLDELPAAPSVESVTDLYPRHQLFGYTNEELEMVLRPMLAEHKEPTWSMGDDAPPAALSRQRRAFADYFRQRFAQVTNPPIDPLREQIVMSLDVYLGKRRGILRTVAEQAGLFHLTSPLLNERQLATIRANKDERFQSRTLSTTFPLADGSSALEQALDRLEQEATLAIQEGITLLVLSDSEATFEQPPIPMPIAIGALHQSLVRQGLRTQVSLICETGTACDVHSVVLVLGYGAEAIVPTLALASARALITDRRLEHLSREEAEQNYLIALEGGVRKVMARMGISTVRNIIGAGQFEILGLTRAFVERCFGNSAAYYGNVSPASVAEKIITHLNAVKEEALSVDTGPRKRKLPDLGRYRFRKDGEYHAYNPLIVRALQKAALSGSTEDYQQLTSLIYHRPKAAVRDLLRLREQDAIPLSEVESMEAIRARFVISAMSVGALSAETHQTIAAAMNSIGGRNNTGEGGEDPEWYYKTLEGHPVSSKIKQIASARFGVTAEYLVRAEEIEIKMAQGAKPGEGGQLPPAKVSGFIAKLRHTSPGVALISPPPHHDIYSIEDLAQLIYDLRQINPTAKIGVKLVSTIGVGTIAAGVAKGHANYVLISGQDGGTGASPLQSIKHAGMPWELGLAEAQQVLVKNGLRQRVKLRADGGFKTGRDVVIAAMLGAEEYGFGTAALVSLGCDMARQCHLNTCPAGIATQREDLRAKFTGRAQHLVNYLTLVAEEVRTFLAQLGVRSMEELIGRADLLEASEDSELDLQPLLAPMPVKFVPGMEAKYTAARVSEQLVEDARPALDGEQSVLLQYPIHNDDRAVGVRLAGAIAGRYGNEGLPGVSVTASFLGVAGQSFGAFAVAGMRFFLHGAANDYVAKGMTGGQIVVTPPTGAQYASHRNTIVGNTVLYGATGGELFVAGRAGERFAVRNSGGVAVVEGVGDHGCEYMTGGMVVVLGETGKNFAAGMSSGVAYVLDVERQFPSHCNTELVQIERVFESEELQGLRHIVARHARKTHSKYADELLQHWTEVAPYFWRIRQLGGSLNVTNFIPQADYDELTSARAMS